MISGDTGAESPSLHWVLRRRVAPLLGSWPSLRVWHAGIPDVSSVYLTAIVLAEAGLLSRTLLWATDADPSRVEAAFGGPAATDFGALERAYARSDGGSRLEEYCRLAGGAVQDAEWRPNLRRHLTFFAYDPAHGSSFSEFQLVLADARAAAGPGSRVIHDSLCPFGVLLLTDDVLSRDFRDPRYQRLAFERPTFRKLER